MKVETLRAILMFTATALAGLQLNAQQTQPPRRIREAVDESRRVVLEGHIHPLAQARYDHGPAPADLPMEHILLLLQRTPEQQQALDRLLEDQQDHRSPSYHRWLAPEEFGQKFGPAAEDTRALTRWLESHGFRIDDVSKGGLFVEFSGTAGLLKEAFHTEMHQYLVNGEHHWANQSNPEIPAALAPVVEGFVSLHDFHAKSHGHRVSMDSLSSPQYTSGSAHGLSPADYGVIYNLNPLYSSGINGTGTTIAVVGRSNIISLDVPDFRKVFGLTVNPPQIVINGTNPGLVPGDQDEATLDVSWAGAIAPNATVKLVVSQSTSSTDGITLSAKYIVEHNLADVVTESYGACEARSYSPGDKAITEQAAAQGITWLVSSGDSGSAGCDDPTQAFAVKGLGVNTLATQYVIAVGGTQFDDTANPAKYWSSHNSSTFESALSYIPEKAWNESCAASRTCTEPLLASGGGVSTKYPRPSWQVGVPGIPNDGNRNVPDVSLTAAGHDPYLICLNTSCSGGKHGFEGIGGTSAAAPSFAGIMALVVQQMGGRQGLANPVLYALARQQSFALCNGSSATAGPIASCVFNDITSGNNAVPGEKGYGTTSATYPAGTGYDLATGLGSVNAFNLINSWNSVRTTASITSLRISSVNIAAGSTAAVTVTVSAGSGSVIPTGDVGLILSTTSGYEMVPLTLSGGIGTTSTKGWAAGTYTVSAHYIGDNVFEPSISPGIKITIH